MVINKACPAFKCKDFSIVQATNFNTFRSSNIAQKVLYAKHSLLEFMGQRKLAKLLSQLKF